MTPIFEQIDVYPACAGIDLTLLLAGQVYGGLPRMRGDRPGQFTSGNVASWFTPHARGSTLLRIVPSEFGIVYPACAGIDLRKDVARRLFKGLPRMRGDRPSCRKRLTFPLEFTPHARGSTFYNCCHELGYYVYPACAGIDLHAIMEPSRSIGLPRMRGDRP